MLILAAVLGGLGIVVVLGTYLVLRDRPGWESNETGNAIEVAAVVAGLLGAAGAVVLGQWLVERRTAAGIESDALETWRRLLLHEVLDKRVRGEGSQLVQMVRQTRLVDVLTAPVDLDDAEVPGSPRLRVGRRTLDLRRIKARWDRSPHRLVILGEPGHGKTVALLSLLGQVNRAPDQPGRSVAELFSLAEWAGWETGHPEAPLASWLADSLRLTYPQLDLDRATARQLIDQGLVIPLLDGLDEVPEARRVRCRDTINAYAGRSAPYRPFALTCRSAEYEALAPDWVAADEQVHLLPLDRQRIEQQVAAEAAGLVGAAAPAAGRRPPAPHPAGQPASPGHRPGHLPGRRPRRTRGRRPGHGRGTAMGPPAGSGRVRARRGCPPGARLLAVHRPVATPGGPPGVPPPRPPPLRSRSSA